MKDIRSCEGEKLPEGDYSHAEYYSRTLVEQVINADRIDMDTHWETSREHSQGCTPLACKQAETYLDPNSSQELPLAGHPGLWILCSLLLWWFVWLMAVEVVRV